MTYNNNTQPADTNLHCPLFGHDDAKCAYKGLSGVYSFLWLCAPAVIWLIMTGQEMGNTIIAVRRSFASISIIGCVFVIVIITVYQKYKAFVQRLILYLSIVAIVYDIVLLMGGLYPPGPVCTFQAFSLNFIVWMMLLLVCCITFNLYMNAIWLKSTEKYEWIYAVVCIVVPLVLSCLPFINNRYGPAGAWCWIVDDWGWRFGLWYMPLFTLIFIMACVYGYILYVFKRKLIAYGGTNVTTMEKQREQLRQDISHLWRYPLVYLICSIFQLINRIQNAVSPNPVYALVLLHAMAAPLPGMLNAIVFALDKDTASKLTWTQFKLAFHTHRVRSRGESEIQEYYPGAGTLDNQSVREPHDQTTGDPYDDIFADRRPENRHGSTESYI